MTRFTPATILALLPLIAACAPAAAAEPPKAGSWHFTVFLDGKRIGEHDFSVAPQGDEVAVETEAHFKIKAAFIALYQYDHHDHEVWRGGCLAQIAAETHDNGKSLAVQGALKGNVFEVQGSRGAAALPACVRSFAYWDQHYLTGPRLLNSQTGEYQSVTLEPEGTDSVRVRGQSMPAQHYLLRAPQLAIDLWYSQSGDWLALESKLESGRVLRYEIE
jgi:hypothetical protein